jgi:predicted protein tyrosine phosphatase
MAATNRPTRRRLALIVVAAFLLYASAAALWWQAHRVPRRFAVVVAGQLYRSGEVTPGQLRRLQREYGIGRVISLLAAASPLTIAERRTARQLGIQWENVPLPGNGASTAADRQRILALLARPSAPPTLIHCAAGVNRTGLAVGLYRLHDQHWTLAQVMEELRSFGFEDGPSHENLRQALAAEAACGEVDPKQQGTRAIGTSPLEEEER